jgi:site-specific DNA-methyltransferase (adenine-specific)
LDFFAGSGTTGAVASQMGRRFVMIDSEVAACRVMSRRLGSLNVAFVNADGEAWDDFGPETGVAQLF